MGKQNGSRPPRSQMALGRSLMKTARVGGTRENGEKLAEKRTLSLNHEKNEKVDNRNQFDSVLERKDLSEFVEMSKLANTDFKPEKRGPVVLSSVTKKALREPTIVELNGLRELHEQRLKVPRRPAWEKSMSKFEIHENEKAGFLQWRRTLADFEEDEGLVLTPFERNLEMWRQLWRVVERSDVVVQVLDCRNPLLFRCPDFENFVAEVDPSKRNVLLLNKADLMSLQMRQSWAEYLQKRGLKFLFWSALNATKQNEAKKAAAADLAATGAEGHGDEDQEGELVHVAGGTREREEWYETAATYWEGVEATVDGVLGGFGDLTDVDLRDSHIFFGKQVGVPNRHAITPGTLACDCGAGIGRVSKGLLLDYYDKVDMVEQCPIYTAEAEMYVDKERVGTIYTQGLQDFDPPAAKYDMIWIQWVIGHLSDEDFVAFLQRCMQALKPGGMLGMKENNALETEVFQVDEEDSSVTRSDTELRRLFTLAGLQVDNCTQQEGFPDGMFEIRMYALSFAPLPTADAAQESAAVDTGAQKPELEPEPEPESEPDFTAASTFDGAKEGFFFGTGNLGVGYYLDQKPVAGSVSGEQEEHSQVRTRKVQPTLKDTPQAKVRLSEAELQVELEEEMDVWANWDPVHVHDANEVMTMLRKYAESRRKASMARGSYQREDGRAVIGMVGCPNVGKSTTVNALTGNKDVAVSETPGKTKHFQTIVLDEDLLLCDCPGLVFPTLSGTRAEQVVSGILRIDEMRDATAPMTLVCERIPRAVLEQQYSVYLPVSIDDMPGVAPKAHSLMSALAQARGFMTTGRPDESRAARMVLKDYMNGVLLYAHPPPGASIRPDVGASRVPDAQVQAQGAAPLFTREHPIVYPNKPAGEAKKKGKRRSRAFHDDSGGSGVLALSKGKGKMYAGGFVGSHGQTAQQGSEGFTRAHSVVHPEFRDSIHAMDDQIK